MRKPSRAVELDDIICQNIIGVDSLVIGLILKIHLALETLIIEMMGLYLIDDRIYKLSFPAKTEWLLSKGVITSGDKNSFDRFNDFRNDIAHIFGHTISISDCLKLARDLEADGVDFSDSFGSYSETEATDFYEGAIGILAEVGWCLLAHAANRLMEFGGRDINSAQ